MKLLDQGIIWAIGVMMLVNNMVIPKSPVEEVLLTAEICLLSSLEEPLIVRLEDEGLELCRGNTYGERASTTMFGDELEALWANLVSAYFQHKDF